MQIGSNNNYTLDPTVYSSTQKTNKEECKEPSEKEKTESSSNIQDLDPAQQQQVAQLQARDTEVRAHEAAHKAAGGGLAGGATFSYQKGPDGKMYAIGGEVSISFKAGSTPEETIANARQVVAAALAPANPSPQDHAVASNARMMEAQAQQELVKKLQEEQRAQTGHETYANAHN